MHDFEYEDLHGPNFKKLVNQTKQDIMHKIANGSCSSLDSYKQECGRINGLNEALVLYAQASQQSINGEGTEHVAELRAGES